VEDGVVGIAHRDLVEAGDWRGRGGMQAGNGGLRVSGGF
jgi:hypothetical protein